MKTVEIVSKLNKMYDDYYCKDQGYCKYFEECRKGRKKVFAPQFYSDRVKVGAEYGIDSPRIVFVGLEGVHADGTLQIPEIDINDEWSRPSLVETNNHYRGVRYVLSYLMCGILGKDKPENATVKALDGDQVYLNKYCLTNIFKCAFGEGRSGLPHTKSMQEHCPELFKKEMEILRPDILVIQVVTNRPSFLSIEKMKENFGKRDVQNVATVPRNPNTAAYKLYFDDGKSFYCIWTYHGNGGPYTQKEGGVFVNNSKYITEELNPVLDEVIKRYRNES